MSRCLAALAALLTTSAMAQPGAPTPSTAQIESPRVFISRHTGEFNGQRVRYRAIAGETYLTNDRNEPTASLFSVTYLREDVRDPTTRPVIFIFNGGPGSSSVWLHMGLFGPKRVVVPSDASDDGAAPFVYGPNPQSMLDVTDLVMIDPVGTGYSRTIGAGSTRDYYGHREDATSIGEFIRLWLNEHRRWMSPKYLAAESYGTVRAALMADIMGWGSLDIALNGIILMSQILDYGAAQDEDNNLLAYVHNLPAMAVAALYHKKVSSPLGARDFGAEARRFAIDEYLPALVKGRDLPPPDYERVLTGLQRFTGLSRDYLMKSNLRVKPFRFAKELLRNEGLSIGMFDVRYTGHDLDRLTPTPSEDASAYGNGSAYTAAINELFTRELGVKMNAPYKTLNMEPYLQWNWRTTPPSDYYEPSYSDVTKALAQALVRNQRLSVLVACGLYDLVTTCSSAEYVFSQPGIPAGRTTIEYYDAGHMMYMHEPSFEKLVGDMRRFVAGQARGSKAP